MLQNKFMDTQSEKGLGGVVQKWQIVMFQW